MSKQKLKKKKERDNRQPSSGINLNVSGSSSSLKKLSYSLNELIKKVLSYLKTFVKAIFIMMMSAVTCGGGGNMSSKKEAKLRNKQRKLEAEYALVTGGNDGGEDGGAGGKKRKLDESGGRKDLNGEDFKAMKLELRERKRGLTQIPRLRLTQMAGLNASIFQTEYATRTPLLLSDIQHLVTYAYGGNELVPPPSRWCHFQKPNKLVQIVVLVVDGFGLNEFVDNEEDFHRSMKIFGGDSECNRGLFEILDPSWYGGSGFEEVGGWGLFGGVVKADEDQNQNPTEKNAVVGKSSKNAEDKSNVFDNDLFNRNFSTILNQLRSVFPISDDIDHKQKGEPKILPVVDQFPRTSLLLTLPQLIQENYPLPIPANTLTRNISTGYTLTSSNYACPTPNSKMYSIDCEMCEAVGDPNALIRIGVVDEDCNVVFESLVKPKEKVLDYRTRWSGVKPVMMEGVKVRLKDVQRELMKLVEKDPGCIFIGQSLNCDLKSLRLIHPYIIDTSTIFNLSGIAGKKSSLKDLSLNLLDELIQNKESRDSGHCPVEDARAAMKLVKAKLANGFSFGNVLKLGGGSGNTDSNMLVCVEEHIVKSQLSNCSNKLSKDVLLVAQKDEQTPFTFCDNPTTNQKTALNEKITVRNATTNGSVVETMYNHFLEYFLTVGFYRICENESQHFHKTLGKLDKRIEKVFNRASNNSLVIVVGTGGSSTGADNKHETRRNNGVCLVRVKVNDGRVVRRD